MHNGRHGYRIMEQPASFVALWLWWTFALNEPGVFESSLFVYTYIFLSYSMMTVLWPSRNTFFRSSIDPFLALTRKPKQKNERRKCKYKGWTNTGQIKHHEPGMLKFQ